MGLSSVWFSWACLLSAWLIFCTALAVQGPSGNLPVCLSDEFSCGQKCIPYMMVCDKKPNCDDKSDESNCHPELTCKAGEFKCAKDGTCIPLSGVCNGFDDCKDGADERQPACGEKRPHIVIAEGNSISKAYPGTDGGKLLVARLFTGDMRDHPIDYFWRDQAIVTFDNQHHIGYDVKHDTTSGWIRKDRIPSMSLFVSNLAVDQASGNLYFVDPRRKIVGILSDTTMTVVVGNDGAVYPYGVAVDSLRGYLYFSDVYGGRDDGGIIRKCYLDGSNCITLFHSAGLPRSMAIDPFEKVLFYIDVKLNLIGKVSLDGTRHEVIHRFNATTLAAYLTIDRTHCYWTDGTHPTIFNVKRDGSSSTVDMIPITAPAAYGVAMVPPLQANVTNKCSVNNGGCSHFCFANPDGLECGCPLHDHLGPDGKSCIDHAPRCPPNAKFACGSDVCLPHEALCDGLRSCRDEQHDEVNCTKTTCHKNDFLCDNSTCLSTIHVCNGIPNCANGLDEAACGQCAAGNMMCSNGTCISARSMCNGKLDCLDGADESPALCNLVTCTADEFFCADGRHCIPMTSRCDGHPTCPDESDEAHCDVPCEAPAFECDGQCFPSTRRCDGKSDCFNNSDEAQCATGGDNKSSASPYLVVAAIFTVLVLIFVIVVIFFCINKRRGGSGFSSVFRRMPFHRFRHHESIYSVHPQEHPNEADDDKSALIVSVSSESGRGVEGVQRFWRSVTSHMHRNLSPGEPIPPTPANV